MKAASARNLKKEAWKASFPGPASPPWDLARKTGPTKEFSLLTLRVFFALFRRGLL
jgi:hypothetical protein